MFNFHRSSYEAHAEASFTPAKISLVHSENLGDSYCVHRAVNFGMRPEWGLGLVESKFFALVRKIIDERFSWVNIPSKPKNSTSSGEVGAFAIGRNCDIISHFKASNILYDCSSNRKGKLLISNLRLNLCFNMSHPLSILRIGLLLNFLSTLNNCTPIHIKINLHACPRRRAQFIKQPIQSTTNRKPKKVTNLVKSPPRNSNFHTS